MTAEPDGPSSSFLAPEYSNLMCELSTVYPPVRVVLGGSHSMPRIHGDEIGLLNYLGMIRPISDHTSKHGRLAGLKQLKESPCHSKAQKTMFKRNTKFPGTLFSLKSCCIVSTFSASQRRYAVNEWLRSRPASHRAPRHTSPKDNDDVSYSPTPHIVGCRQVCDAFKLVLKRTSFNSSRFGYIRSHCSRCSLAAMSPLCSLHAP